MKGIIGAATVVGCLQHGVGICDERSTGSSLLVELKAGSLSKQVSFRQLRWWSCTMNQKQVLHVLGAYT